MKSKRFRHALRPVAAVAALLVAQTAFAAGFAARISPPRFELAADPGDVLRHVIEIGNADDETGNYVIRTADWDLNESGGVIVHPETLQTGSCRPWSRIERRALSLPPGADKRFRFEVHVPQDAPSGECRFAILISPDPDSPFLATMGDVRFPVAGQIAVIVYVVVGDARPILELKSFALRDVDGTQIPVAQIFNAGNAHGRPRGLLEGTHADNEAVDFVVSPSPILPGRTVNIPLWPTSPLDSQLAVKLVAPIQLKGPIEWEGGEFPVETTLP